MKRKGIIALLCMIMTCAALSAGAAAAELFQPYGYSLPPEAMANNPSSLNEQNYISGLDRGKSEYDAQNGFKFSPSGDAGLFVILGGKGYSGENLTQAVSAGKMKTTLTFSIDKSDNPNKPTNPVEWLDIRSYVKQSGKDYEVVGVKYFYAWDTYYAVDMDGLGRSAVRADKLYFGRFYTYTIEFDVTKGNIYQSIKDYETGNLIAERTLTGLSLEAARNGARARFFPMWDVGIKEFSCYRETFLVKNEQITADSSSVTASFDAALDCSENTDYGKLDSASPVLVLCQYDKNNRLLSYKVSSVKLTQKTLSTVENDYKTVTATVEKSRYYDHAAAYIWNNEDDMFAYCEPLTVR